MLLATRTFIIQKKHFMIQQIRAVTTTKLKGDMWHSQPLFYVRNIQWSFQPWLKPWKLSCFSAIHWQEKGPVIYQAVPSSGVVSLVVDIEDTRATFPSSIVLPYSPGFTAQLRIAHLFKKKTSLKTNIIAPEHGWLEYDRFLSGMAYFQELLLMDKILHQLIGSLSHYFQGFIHTRRCRISSINSMLVSGKVTISNPPTWPVDLVRAWWLQCWHTFWLLSNLSTLVSTRQFSGLCVYLTCCSCSWQMRWTIWWTHVYKLCVVVESLKKLCNKLKKSAWEPATNRNTLK